MKRTKAKYSYRNFTNQAKSLRPNIFINGNTPILIYPCSLTAETYNAIMSLETSNMIIQYRRPC